MGCLFVKHRNDLCTLDIKDCLDTRFLIIIPLKKKSHFSIISFYAHISHFDEIQWSVCNSFAAQAFCGFPRSQIQGHVVFSSKRFMVLTLTFRLLMDFEVIFI